MPPRVFARTDPRSLPVTKVLISKCNSTQVLYQDDAAHESECSGSDCPRCFFEAGYIGCIRRGSTELGHQPNPTTAWADRFTFTHPSLGSKSWLTVAPWSQPPTCPWGIGCWVCHEYGLESAEVKWCNAFASLSVNSRSSFQASNFQKHEACHSHRQALERMNLAAGAQPPLPSGVFSGVSDGVPRIDKFHLAATIAARKASLSDAPAFSETQALGSSAASDGDISRFACAKMILCMAEPYRVQDQLIIKHDP